jgi:hypothetical protein
MDFGIILDADHLQVPSLQRQNAPLRMESSSPLASFVLSWKQRKEAWKSLNRCRMLFQGIAPNGFYDRRRSVSTAGDD